MPIAKIIGVAAVILSTALPAPAAPLDGRCKGWERPGALADYARRADRTLNRDAAGDPIFSPLMHAAWLLERRRWGDARYAMLGMGTGFPHWRYLGRRGERIRPVIDQLLAVLHECSAWLGYDNSMHPMPLPDKHSIAARPL